MTLPTGPKPARDYYRVALNRLEDSEVLFEQNYTTAAVYLAGYAIECITKALVLTRAPRNRQQDIFNSFRGWQGHDIAWLHRQYNGLTGQLAPSEVRKAFVLAHTWNTDLRYKPGVIPLHDAEDFLSAAKVIVAWADRSML